MKIIVVIPTYNEVQNIGKLIPILIDEFKKIPQHECIILVVDGNSPDGTGKIVTDFSKNYSFVHLLLEKEKKGLGGAYIEAFKYAITNFDADVLIEMDADFQHDPKDVVKLVEKIDEGYDYVIGSRFAKKGSLPEEWEFYRKFLSFGGSLFSKFVLWIFNINDFTSGFKASRVKGFVDKIDLDSIRSRGFAYKIDLLYKMYKAGAKFIEVPIKFGLRDRGDSKMEKNNFFDSLRVVLSIRISENLSFFKFATVGVVGVISDTSLFNIFRLTFAGNIASLLSGFISMTITFILNNNWSFGENKLSSKKDFLKSAPIYYISSAIPIVFRSWLISYANTTFGNTFIVSNLAFVLGILVGLIWNFTVYSRIIWKKRN